VDLPPSLIQHLKELFLLIQGTLLFGTLPSLTAQSANDKNLCAEYQLESNFIKS